MAETRAEKRCFGKIGQFEVMEVDVCAADSNDTFLLFNDAKGIHNFIRIGFNYMNED